VRLSILLVEGRNRRGPDLWFWCADVLPGRPLEFLQPRSTWGDQDATTARLARSRRCSPPMIGPARTPPRPA